jgi:hypothetical protein
MILKLSNLQNLRQKGFDEELSMAQFLGLALDSFGLCIGSLLLTSFLPCCLGLLVFGFDQLLPLVGIESGEDGLSSLGLGVRIQFDEISQVGQSVLLVDNVFLDLLLTMEVGLDFSRVDQTTEIRVGQSRSGKAITNFEMRGFLVGSIQSVELKESILGPDDKSSEMTSRSKLEEVQAMNADEFNTRDVSKGSEKWDCFVVVDNQRSASLDITPVPHFTLSCTKSLGLNDFFDIGVCVDFLEESDSIFGLIDLGNGFFIDNERDLGDTLNPVSAGEYQ